jgi:uncharacterized protein (TIGR02246 family)
MSEALLQELLDREAIKEVKARYFRAVDDKDWEAFRAVFTDDARFELVGFDQPPIEGAEAFVAFTAQVTENARTVHHGHMPEITFDSPTEARGIWILNDYIEWPSDDETGERRGMVGFGRYYERYRKVGGEWLIAGWELKYQRIDALLPDPLPELVLP